MKRSRPSGCRASRDIRPCREFGWSVNGTFKKVAWTLPDRKWTTRNNQNAPAGFSESWRAIALAWADRPMSVGKAEVGPFQINRLSGLLNRPRIISSAVTTPPRGSELRWFRVLLGLRYLLSVICSFADDVPNFCETFLVKRAALGINLREPQTATTATRESPVLWRAPTAIKKGRSGMTPCGLRKRLPAFRFRRYIPNGWAMQRFRARTKKETARPFTFKRAASSSLSYLSTVEGRSALQNHYRRRATATPNRNATNSEPRGASRAILLKILNGIPGFRPASIAPLTRLTVPFTASETSAMVDLGSGTGSKPS